MFKVKNADRLMTGKKGEVLAKSYLVKNGYQILETNYRCPLGEIDLIARDGQDLVFVEVKTRTSRELGYPEQAVGAKKQRKISQLALFYLQQKNLMNTGVRFDVVAVTIAGASPEIKLIKNAFDFTGA